MKVLYRIFLFFLAISLFQSCVIKNESRILLVLDESNSSVMDSRLLMDSICFDYKDSVTMYKYYPEHLFEISFLKSRHGVYESRSVYDYDNGSMNGEYLRNDSILTLSTKDTTFIYKYAPQAIATVWDYSYADSRYEIKKSDDGNYITTKQSLIDSTYKEVYYYDKEYRITKFINTYKGNICTYIPKK